jgi:hypothetical protein
MGDRFARTAGQLAQLQDARSETLAARVRPLLSPARVRALDSGTGAVAELGRYVLDRR